VLTYGDDPAAKSAAAEALSRAGFEPSGEGLVLWPSRASRVEGQGSGSEPQLNERRAPAVLNTYPRN
jgi:hypothetical protein